MKLENKHVHLIFEDYDHQAALRRLKGLKPTDIIEAVKESGLRGRGGAGFPTGLKWTFMPPVDPDVPRFLCCNGDESEPGTFKDRFLMTYIPHALIEGMIVSSYALGANTSYIYIRGEMLHQYHILEKAIAEAHDAGEVGAIAGSWRWRGRGCTRHGCGVGRRPKRASHQGQAAAERHDGDHGCDSRCSEHGSVPPLGSWPGRVGATRRTDPEREPPEWPPAPALARMG